jgi:DNA-binding IclR family transcriptional regulator
VHSLSRRIVHSLSRKRGLRSRRHSLGRKLHSRGHNLSRKLDLRHRRRSALRRLRIRRTDVEGIVPRPES